MSDGYFAVPWPDGQPRTWDDWGWFVQSPWFDRSAGLPVLGVVETRQIGGLGIHVDFSFMIALSVVWLSIRRIENATDNHAAYIAVVGWLLYFAGGAGFVVSHYYGFDDSRRLTAVIGGCLAVPASFSAIKRVVRSRRVRNGHCNKCGYNLFGNTSGRCPECGTPLAEASA